MDDTRRATGDAGGRPRIVMNWVVGADGAAIDAHGGSLALSSREDRASMDALRAEVDAVLVGAATIRHEDPSLGVADAARRAERARVGRATQPLPVVLSASGDLPADARIFAPGEPRPLVLTTRAGAQRFAGASVHADVAVLPGDEATIDAVLAAVGARGVARLLVEGGPATVRAFVAAGAVDDVHVTVSPRLGGQPAPATLGALDPLLELDLADVRRVGSFLFLRYVRAASAAARGHA